jgi:hypothetical protein
MRQLLRRAGLAATAGTVPFIFATSAHAAQASEPAGGAALGDVMLASAGASVLTVLVFGLGYAHRSGRLELLARASSWSERKWGLPGWAALPGEIAALSLIVALLGMYWDISLHIDQGRDPGPLANPAHFLILAGLFGVFVSGFLAIVLPREGAGASGVRIAGSWYAPVGGLLLFSCAAFSLLGFPLDDAWHRLFGQDVTLWGPTHLMLFGGAAMTLIGRSVLLVEGARAMRGGRNAAVGNASFVRFQRAALLGGFLIGLSTFQGEFDFGVPQFSFLFQPTLIMIAAGVALVAARLWAGRGGAFVAAGVFLLIRGCVTVIVGPVFGETTPHFPLYLAEAGLVELAALRGAESRPLAFGLRSGILIGTVGLAAEWGWSHVWMPLPWNSSLLPEAAIIGLVSAIAASTIGAVTGAALASDRIPRPRGAGAALAAACFAVVAVFGYGLDTSPTTGQSARVTLTDVHPGPARTVSARVTLDPPNAANDARWLTATAWQGGGLVVNRLERVGPGIYRTTTPIPVHGKWKAMLRLHTGNSLEAIPIYLPRDAAIPAAEVPAPRAFTRTFVPDRRILQREAKTNSAWISVLAYLTVLAIALGLLAVLAWGLRRLARAGRADWGRAGDASSRSGERIRPSRRPAALPRGG